eukprot:6191383-Pleurochrysis_carterae.AAC.1
MAPARLCAAVYLSTAVRETVAAAARAAAFPAVSLVDVFTDDTYARSSLKLVGETGPLLQAARLAALEAVRLIDLQNEPHPAPHPRCGAVDMVAFMPLSEASATDLAPELRTCEDLATQLGVSLGDAGCSVLLYGPQRGRTLLEARRHTSFFKSASQVAPARCARSGHENGRRHTRLSSLEIALSRAENSRMEYQQLAL